MVASGKMANQGNKLALELVLGIGTPSVPAHVYVGLSTATVDEDSTLATITECTDATYSRQEATFGTPSEVSDAMRTYTTSDITFGAFTTGGIAITHAFLTDAASGTTGNVIACHTLGTTKYTNAGETLKIVTGDLYVQYD